MKRAIAIATTIALTLASLSYQIAVADTLHEDAKQTGHAIGEAAHDVGQGTKKIVKQTGHTTKKVAKDVGHGTKKVVKTVGKTVKEAAVETGHAFRDGAKELKNAAQGKESK